MKKILTILLAVMVVVGFTACNQVQPGYQIGARQAVVNATEDDAQHYAMKTNAENAAVSVTSDNVITISANEKDLEKCVSDDAEQAELGEQYWIGVLINTNLDTIKDAAIKEGSAPYTFNDDDVNEAKGVGGNPSEFVLWVRADEALGTPTGRYPRSFQLLDKDGAFVTDFTVVLDIEPVAQQG